MNVPTSPVNRVCLKGVGWHLPASTLTNEQLVRRGAAPSADWIFEKTGIRERRIAEPGQAMSDMVIPPAAAAIQDAGLGPTDIDAVLVAGDAHDSGGVRLTSAIVADAIGISAAQCIDLRVGCPASICGLHVGTALVAAGQATHALVCSGEINTRSLDFSSKKAIFFGDGGAAVVLSRKPGFAAVEQTFYAGTGRNSEILEIPAGGSRETITEASLKEGRHLLHMDGGAVLRYGTSKLSEVVPILAEAAGLSLPQLDWLVPHQANLRIIHAAAANLGIPLSKFILNIERVGNTAGPSCLIALAQAICAGRILPGQTVINCGIWGRTGLGGGQVLRFVPNESQP